MFGLDVLVDRFGHHEAIADTGGDPVSYVGTADGHRGHVEPESRPDGILDLRRIDSGPGQHRHLCSRHDFIGSFPRRQAPSSVGTQDQPELLVGGEGGERVRSKCPTLTMDLPVVGMEIVDSLRGPLGHLPSHRRRTNRVSGLLPGRTGGNEEDSIDAELAVGDFSGQQMGDVGWIESPSHQAA